MTIIMTRKRKKEERKKPGPKLSFSNQFLYQIKLLAMLGATNKQIALFFAKDPTTIENYIQKYPEFRDARKQGGMVADLKVVQSLFKRATGYDFVEQQLVMVLGQPVKVKVKKHIIPDVKAIMLWLTNRQRALWTNSSQVRVSGEVSHKHYNVEDIPVEKLSKKSQELLFEIGKEQLTNGVRDN